MCAALQCPDSQPPWLPSGPQQAALTRNHSSTKWSWAAKAVQFRATGSPFITSTREDPGKGSSAWAPTEEPLSSFCL